MICGKNFRDKEQLHEYDKTLQFPMIFFIFYTMVWLGLEMSVLNPEFFLNPLRRNFEQMENFLTPAIFCVRPRLVPVKAGRNMGLIGKVPTPA